MYYQRSLFDSIKSSPFPHKAHIIVGPRQVGKTTLLKSLLEKESIIFFDGDDPVVRHSLSEANKEELRALIGASKIIFIDEAQRIPGSGLP